MCRVELWLLVLKFVHFCLFCLQVLSKDEDLVTKFVALLFLPVESLLRLLKSSILCDFGLWLFVLEFVHFCLFCLQILPKDEDLVTEFVTLLFLPVESLLRLLKSSILCDFGLWLFVLEFVHFCLFCLQVLPKDEDLVTEFVTLLFLPVESLLRLLKSSILCDFGLWLFVLEFVHFCLFCLQVLSKDEDLVTEFVALIFFFTKSLLCLFELRHSFFKPI